MDYLEREGFAKLRAGKSSSAVRWVVQRLALIADDAGEDSAAYLEACYRGAKVLAAAGKADGAIKVLNMVPKEASQSPDNALLLATLALEFGEGLRRLGDAQTAERIIGLGHGLRRETYGPRHPKTGLAALYGARICFDLQRWTDAARFFETSLLAFGPHHPFGAVVCADRAYLVSAGSQEVFPFPRFTLAAPVTYWKRIIDRMAYTTLHVPLDLRLAVLLNVSSELQERVEQAGELVGPLLVAAYRHALLHDDERAPVIGEVLEENGWLPKQLSEAGDDLTGELPALDPQSGSDTELFWRCPDRDSSSEAQGMDGWFRLYEAVEAWRTGDELQAQQLFQTVQQRCSDATLEHWAATGCMRYMQRGGRLPSGAFNPQPRALEALALSMMPKALQAKIHGLKLTGSDGNMGVAFVGDTLTDAQQTKAMNAVRKALAWILDRTD